MSEMSSKERLIAAIKGDPVDRLPWSPFLAYWWENQPEDFQSHGQQRFNKDIGADFLFRGPSSCFRKIDDPRCETITHSRGSLTQVQNVTPVGTLTTVSQFSPQGNTEFVVEHPVKCLEDFKILSYYLDCLQLEPDYEHIRAGIQEIGDDGLYVPVISPFGKTPFQALIEHYVGTQELQYFLQDDSVVVEECLHVMSRMCRKAVEISVQSPADIFISWEDSSTTNLSPMQFKKYIAPELDAWGGMIHGCGKLFIHHACGHVRSLLPIMAQLEIDMVESLSPPPTGNIEIWDAQVILGEKIGLIGGIEPTHFLTLDMKALHEYVEFLLDQMSPNHYVLANSDSCPPGVNIEKFRLVSSIIRDRTF